MPEDDAMTLLVFLMKADRERRKISLVRERLPFVRKLSMIGHTMIFTGEENIRPRVGGGSYFPYILLNEIQTMFSQLAKRSARVLPADLCTDHGHYVKTIDQRS